MANISEVMKSFLSREIPELQALFKDQKSEWLIQFFTALGENPDVTKDRESKLQWTERVFKVIPPDICLHIFILFIEKIHMEDQSFGEAAIAIIEKYNPSIFERAKKRMELFVPECPIDVDLTTLEEALLSKCLDQNIDELLNRIPHYHGGIQAHKNVFYLVFTHGNLELLAKLLDIHLAKIGLEALQNHLEDNQFVYYWHNHTRSETVRQLIDIYRQRGLDPLYLILPKNLSQLSNHFAWFVEICIPYAPQDKLIAFIKANGAELLHLFLKEVTKEQVVGLFEKCGIPCLKGQTELNFRLLDDAINRLKPYVKMTPEELGIDEGELINFKGVFK